MRPQAADVINVHGFVRTQDGTITTFDPPGSLATSPSDINPAGAITGYYQVANHIFHGFLRARHGAYTVFDPPGSLITETEAINSVGAITGFYCDFIAVPPCHGFLRKP